MSSINASGSSPLLAHDRTAFAATLQRSFGRLSGTADTEADTPAWAARFSAASQRLADHHAAAQQEAAWQQATDLLTRIGELRDLAADPAASADQQAGYGEEFAQLQQSLVALNEPFNGSPLLFDTDAAATVSENSGAASKDGATSGPVSAASVSFADDFSTADNWVSTDGALAVSDGTFYPNASGGFGAVQAKQAFRGPMEITFDLFLPGAFDSLDLTIGGTSISNLTDTVNTNKWQQHSVRIVYDGVDTASTYVDGADTPADQRSGLGALSGVLGLTNYGEGSARLRNFSLTAREGTAAAPAAAADAAAQPDASKLAEVARADELRALDAQTIQDALNEISEQQADSAGESNAFDASSESGETDVLASSAAAEASAAEARQQLLLDSAAAFAAQANVDGYNALALLG
ncbi:hypothetical protein [Oleiharenicola sp. Vm1]|uniref:hypothetical protein n=1 Tax=Oleiharenicola sp. Vm1 TaxID=3398393 RepID=UPI0039F48570